MVELGRKRFQRLPSESAVYRCLVRAGVIDPVRRRRRPEDWKRWERGRPMELWQMDVVGGFLLADGTSAPTRAGYRRRRILFGGRAAAAAREGRSVARVLA